MSFLLWLNDVLDCPIALIEIYLRYSPSKGSLAPSLGHINSGKVMKEWKTPKHYTVALCASLVCSVIYINGELIFLFSCQRVTVQRRHEGVQQSPCLPRRELQVPGAFHSKIYFLKSFLYIWFLRYPPCIAQMQSPWIPKVPATLVSFSLLITITKIISSFTNITAQNTWNVLPCFP